MRNVILVMGSRRESARLIPLYFSLEKSGFSAFICAPLIKCAAMEEMFTLFSLKPDIEITHEALKNENAPSIDGLLKHNHGLILHYKPSFIVTASHATLSFAWALAAFYNQIPVCYLESDTLVQPRVINKNDTHWYHDMHRRFMYLLATYHFVSTAAHAAHIVAQGIRRDAVFCVGNTHVDFLKSLHKKAAHREKPSSLGLAQSTLHFSKKARQLFVMLDLEVMSDDDRETLFISLNKMLDLNPALTIISATDTGGNASQGSVFKHERFFVFPLSSYQDCLNLLMLSDSVLTNSYYLHEQAVCLDKPVIFLHTQTERVETIWAGLTYPTGINTQKILDAYMHILTHYKPGKASILYGQGDAADKIADILATRLGNTQPGQSYVRAKPIG